jgi:hypothetical protein
MGMTTIEAASPSRATSVRVPFRWTSRRRLRQGLGLLWLLDAVLQMQHIMWTRGFGAGIINSAAEDQPLVIAAPVRFAGRLIAGHPAAFNLVFVAIQLAIGAGLLMGRTQRWARIWCGASVVWALGIWVLGEGLGGVLTGHEGLDLGAPGAAFIYALIAVAAWPSARPVGRWLTWAWTAIWVGGAVLQLLPAQRTPAGLGAQVDMAAMMSPGWLARPESSLAGWLANLPTIGAALITGALVVLQAWVGVAALSRGPSRQSALRVGAALAFVFWILCQGFGGISTGTATDPNSAPLLILLAVAIAGSHSQSLRSALPTASTPSERSVPCLVSARQPAGR